MTQRLSVIVADDELQARKRLVRLLDAMPDVCVAAACASAEEVLVQLATIHPDVLVLDMPPGTGDVQLTITQQLNLDGALIVSTPQDLSLKDAVKGVELFKKVDVNLLGLVCNMAGFKCPGCGSVHEVFGNMTKIRSMCTKYDLKMLGEIPLHASISDDADRGKPTVVAEPDGDRAVAFLDIAREIEAAVGLTK